MDKKLTGIVNETDLKNVGCEMMVRGFAHLYMFTCPTHAYLVEKLNGDKYRIIVGYYRENPNDNWR